jgi:hypothetical protein
MKKSELNKTQKRDLDVFNLLLEYHRWDDSWGVEEDMDHGEDGNPEGYRCLSRSGLLIEAKFHAPVNMISVSVTDVMLDEQVQFHFLFDDRPERILEWIVSMGETLSMENYPELLRTTKGKCEMVLVEVSDTEIYEMKPPAEA